MLSVLYLEVLHILIDFFQENADLIIFPSLE